MPSDSPARADRGAASPPRSSVSDDSGLHDIRALARTTKDRLSRLAIPESEIDDPLTTSSSGLRAVAVPDPARAVPLPAASPSATKSPLSQRAQPMPRAARPAPVRRGPWVVGAAVVAAAGAGAVVLASRGDAGPAAALAPPGVNAPTAVAPVPVAVDTSPRPPAVAAVQTLAEPPPAPAVAAPPAPTPAPIDHEPDRAVRVGRAEPAPHASRDARAARGAAPAAGAPARVEAEAGSRSSQSIDDLLREASGGAQGSGASRAATPAAPVKRELGRGDIKAGMGAVEGAARDCYDRYGVAGTVGVKLVVAPTGKVAKVQATGGFAATPTGDCVAAAVQRAAFPSWDGAPMTVQYSFLLSE